MDDPMSLLASTMALPFSAHPDDLPPDPIDLRELRAAFPITLRPVHHAVRRVPLRYNQKPENDESPHFGTGFRI